MGVLLGCKVMLLEGWKVLKLECWLNIKIPGHAELVSAPHHTERLYKSFFEFCLLTFEFLKGVACGPGFTLILHWP